MEHWYIVLFVGLCLLGGSMFLLRSRKCGGLHPVVRGLLDQAVDQRSVMLAEFMDQELAGGRFAGACVEFDEKTVLLDVFLHKELSEWLGEAVLVNFQLDNKGVSSYYQFASRLRGLPRGSGGFGMLLDTPAEISPNRKRRFVRVAPFAEVIIGIGIWPLKATQPRPDNPVSLGAAQIRYRRDHAKHLSLLNVSASGLRLKLKHAQEEQALLDPQPGDRLLCLLMLCSQDGEQTLPFWLECTVANRGEQEDDTIVGLRFNAWAVPHRDKGAVEWFVVGEAGAVGPLGAWVLRQQLAQLTPKKPR